MKPEHTTPSQGCDFSQAWHSRFVPRAALPKQLVSPLGLTRLFAQDGLHGFVHGLGPKAASHHKHDGKVLGQSPVRQRLCGSGVLSLGQGTHVGAEGIAGVHDALLGKPTVQTGKPRANAVHPVRQKPVGDAGKAVLFLDERRDAFPNGLVEQGATGKAAHADHGLWSVRAQQATGLPQAADEFEREAEVAGACQGAVDAADPQAIDVVPGRRDLVHFHAARGAHKANVGLGISALDFVGDGEGGMDVATRAAS